MLASYNFSLQGKSHIKMEKPCQDSSAVVEITPAWKAVIVADGVGSCIHSGTASRIAVETVARVLKESFPGACASDRDFQSLLLIAGHTACNAIEKYVNENDQGNAGQYHTTLAFALCSSNKAYYFNAGDSGIIALDENGQYHSLTVPDNDENGAVYTLAFRDRYQTGRTSFKPVAVLAMTDGVYNKCFPAVLQGEAYEMDVPVLNFLVSYAFGIEDSQAEEDSRKQSENIQKYFMSDECSDMTDDLSVSAVIDTNTVLEVEDIPYIKPDMIDIYWKLVSKMKHYSEDVRKKIFEDFIKENFPDMPEEEIKSTISRYISGTECGKDEKTGIPEDKKEDEKQ